MWPYSYRKWVTAWHTLRHILYFIFSLQACKLLLFYCLCNDLFSFICFAKTGSENSNSNWGMEELSNLDLKSRFSLFEKASTATPADNGIRDEHKPVKRSDSILSRLARWPTWSHPSSYNHSILRSIKSPKRNFSIGFMAAIHSVWYFSVSLISRIHAQNNSSETIIKLKRIIPSIWMCNEGQLWSKF